MAPPFNPLAINLRRQTQHLASIVPPETPCILELQDASSTREFLTILSGLLANPAYTQIIARLFRPILFELCARWLEVGSEDNLVALGLLIEVHEELFPILSRLLRQSFPQGPLGFLLESEAPSSVDPSRLHRLLLLYFRILQANRQLPTQRQWSLAPLSQLIWAEGLNNGVRLLAIKCYSIQAEMGEVESERLLVQILGEVGQVECPLGYGVDVDGSKRFLDGWVMETLEIQRVRKERGELLTERIDFYQREEGDPPFFMENSDLSSSIENIEGVLLLKSSKTKSTPTNYIPISTSSVALNKLAHHISLQLPILLTSSPSAGKALLLHHLASLLHPETKNQIVTLHLADTSFDARSLLGSYVSSTTQPGNFEWKEGVLVRAMREGKWIVLEDVDRGSSEVLGTLKPLVESLRAGKWIGGRASIHIPGHGEVVANEDFLIFATRSVPRSPSNKFPTPTFFAAHKFYEIVLDSPPSDELNIIVGGLFPRLAGIATKSIIHMWDALNTLPTVSSREFGLQDLMKFCRRIERLLPPSYRSMDLEIENPVLSSVFTNPVLKEDIYLEARDVFFGSGTMTASALAATELVASLVGEHLGLDGDRCHWLLNKRIPDFQVEINPNGTTTGLRISSTYLPSHKAQSNPFSSPSRPFALHRPAVCLLSRIATAVSLQEPILLTGETGTGKTSVITHLASLLQHPLVSLNLSNQTESSDLIGGLKPVDVRIPGSLLQERFAELFGITFSRKKNEKFEASIRKAVNESKWKRVVGLWKESVRMAQQRFKAKHDATVQDMDGERATNVALPRKRRKLEEGLEKRERSWEIFLKDVEEFEVQHVQGKGKFTFGFVEGPLIKALRSGHWILLDEINLANPETLECISSLLHGPTTSITLTEQGELEPVPRHPDFRLFACMNPATDVGKKDLPPNIKTKFTEIDVSPPDADKETLLSIVEMYIGSHAIGDKGVIMNIAEFYLAVKNLAEKRLLADGANHRPHFSMRTLARALTFTADVSSTYSLRRAIWEGCLMAFTMVLDAQSTELVMGLAQKHLLAGVRNARSMLAREPNAPPNADDYIKIGPFYLAKGPLPHDPMEHYIMTPSVEAKLKDLARIVLTGRFPLLIEGPTSSGKTSSIEYLAKRTGHEFVRINNHEHTDIQEYIGSYVSDPMTGKLVFQDGLLVQALRKGSWIVLDELNLAPTDVLEALNRLLDDNRELLIPETQEVVRPHPHFMLFATQNPPGLYAGRKILSRAFRNRFLEVHFEDVPQAELEVILCQRCRIAPSYGKKIVEVFRQLQKRRQSCRVFESKQGFVTLRDLFRWAGRDAIGYQELAENGYMLLAERTRRDEDKIAVKEVIETVLNVRVDEGSLYDLSRYEVDFLGCSLPPKTNIIWTKAMQRLFVLVSRALKFGEPVLMVGETGSGKTSVCQLFADAVNRKLHSLSCHQNTETADIIGGLRPLRNRHALAAEAIEEAASALRRLGLLHSDESEHQAIQGILEKTLKAPDIDAKSRAMLEAVKFMIIRSQFIFEWCDGPLIDAMRNGEIFLLDEISLAEDSVLERLNSVLEPERTIVLAERGGAGQESPTIQANEDFRLVATMNPGGDYGKKELSPALRNRFTEIWVPHVDGREDLELIVGSLWKVADLRTLTAPLLDFIEWMCGRIGDRSILTLRDILAWVTFINCIYNSSTCPLHLDDIFHHAAHMTYLDGLGSLPQLSGYSKESILAIKREAVGKLQSLVPCESRVEFDQPFQSNGFVRLGPFLLKIGEHDPKPHLFTLSAPTTQNNAVRLTRACQVPKPILLEGSPGVGKTSLVIALANISGQQLHRINLSDQTDLVDLFGSDLPVEGGRAGEFAWRDGEFLQALQLGHWVLLDEMNLAPQAVLEGLNAVLDHRGSVFIPELGRSFTCHSSFRIFAAQNPLSQGGGRKGLPKSFVNRFTKVYIEELTADDYRLVCRHLFPDIDEEVLQVMIAFNGGLNREVVLKKTFAREGFPWEFNLRDVIRWGSLMMAQGQRRPTAYLDTVYLQRFRTLKDRAFARTLAQAAFGNSAISTSTPCVTLTAAVLELGHLSLSRKNFASSKRCGRLLKRNLTALESLGDCVSLSWLAIIVGGRNSGKTELIRSLASISGNNVREIAVNSATDTMDILGSFEQVDVRAKVSGLLDKISLLLRDVFRTTDGSRLSSPAQHLYCQLQSVRNLNPTGSLRGQVCQIEELMFQLKSSRVISPEEFAQFQSGIDALLSNANATGRFEWVDGPLVKALKGGQWIILDGANLCNPSVLDRLNSLCETNGKLVLSERGFVDGHVEVITPHKDFRLFMTVDPQYGELSRAMRNRGVEITLADNGNETDYPALQDYLRLPALPKSTIPDSEAAIAQFDAVRRGHVPLREIFCSSSSSALGITQCSSTSPGLLDQVTSLSFAIPFSQEVALPFIIRSTVPSLLPLIRRFNDQMKNTLATPNLSWDQMMNHVSSSDFQAGLHAIHNTMANTRGQGAMESWLAKPFDLYLSSKNEECGENQEISTHHITLINYLDLVASNLFSSANNASSIPINQLPENHATIAREVEVLSSLVRDAASFITQNYLDNPYTSSADARRACFFLSYMVYMRNIAHAVPFDFSKAHAILKWLLDLRLDDSSVFSEVLLTTTRMREMLSLTSGLGLTNIWQAFYFLIPDQIQSDLQEFSHLSRCLKDETALEAVRHQILDTVSVAFLQPQVIDTGKYKDLKAKLDSYLLSAVDTSAAQLPSAAQPFETAKLAIELSILSSSPKKCAMNMQRFIHLACGDKEMPLAHLVSYQRLIWMIEHKPSDVESSVLAFVNWFESSWHLKAAEAIPKTCGPAFLHKPIHLLRALEACSTEATSLSQLGDYAKQLDIQMQHMYFECDDQRTRSEMLESFFSKNLNLIASCFNEHTRSSDNTLAKQVQKLLNSSDLHFKNSIAQFVQPLCLMDKPHSSGLSWIALGQVLLSLSVPNVPIDPASIVNSDYNRLENERACLDAQILLHRRFEVLQTGDSSNGLIRYLESQLKSIDEKISGTRHLPERGDTFHLQQFWNEVRHFMEMVLSPAKLDNILNKSRSGNNNHLLEEEVLQESLSSFYQRLDSLYRDFSDLVIIIKLAIQYFRLGLRLIVSFPSSTSHAHDDLMTAVVEFPSVKSASSIIKGMERFETLGTGAFRGILLGTSAIASQAGSGVDSRDWIVGLDKLYQQARGLWNIDRAKGRDVLAAASSLYRKSNLDHSAMTDAEVEEKDFLELFPSFENLVEETPKPDGGTAIPLLVPEDQVSTLCELHFLLLLPAHRVGQRESSVFDGIRKEVVQSLLDLSAAPVTDVLDYHSLPFRFSFLHEKMHLVGDASPNRRPNFYLDSNIPEVSKVVPNLRKLLERLEALQLEWPDQEVLRNLAELCKKVLDINCHSPVAKVLSTIEQLLIRTEDWEIYANRENTLRLHRDALVTQIIEWRRLELSSWQALLEAETNKCRRNGSQWLFQLYDATIRGALSAAAEDESSPTALTVYLTDLVSLLADFMSSCPLGEFTYRLDLLISFSVYSAHLMTTKDGKEKDALRRVNIILMSTQQYFNQFSTKLSALLAAERTVLEKEINKFIKLASWKDINVLALKQSAQRSHHQLYKIVRKFREVLRMPISGQIHPEFVSTPQQVSTSPLPPLSGPDVPRLPPPKDLPSSIGPLAKLQKTFIKFESLVASKIGPMLLCLSLNRAEDLAVEIITSCHRLSSVVAPALPKEKKNKFLKSIQSQKRKAWSDLLKELKFAGFSHRVKPELLAENTDFLWIKQQPLFPRTEQNGMVNKLEGYFCKLQSCLPALRTSSASHHDEVSSRDLSKGIALVEHMFNIGVKLRGSLAESLSVVVDISNTHRRMKNLDLTKVVFYGEDLPEYLSRCHSFMCQSSKMLSELASSIRTFHLPRRVTGDAMHNMVSEVEQRMVENVSTRDGIFQLLNNINASGFSILQEEEHQMLLSCPAFISSLGGHLQHCADLYPQLFHLFQPSHRWLVAASGDLLALPSPQFNAPPKDPDENFRGLINIFLVSIQSATSLCDTKGEECEEHGEEDHYLTRLVHTIQRANQNLNLVNIRSQLANVFSDIRTAETANQFIPRILPFLEVYLRLAHDQLALQAHSVKSLLKLDYVLCSVIQTVATKGFCKPPDESGDGGGEEAAENSLGGVGLGEGSGQENVSKEIEDESQAEGLQGDDSDDQHQDKDQGEREDALEMTEDFGGELEDVPDDESSESHSGSDNGSDVDLEERMEDLDPLDSNAVDEKLWGDDEHGADEKAGTDKSNQEDAKSQENAKSEMAAKEGKDTQPSKDKEKNPDDSLDQDGGEDAQGQQDAPEMEESSEPNPTAAPMDEHIPEGDVLDLPDDMDLGDDDVRNDVRTEELGDDLSGEDEMMPYSDDLQYDEPTIEDQVDGKDIAPEDDYINLEEKEQPNLTSQTDDDENSGEEDSTKDEVTGKADISSGNGVVEEDTNAGNADQNEGSGRTGASRRGGDRGAESTEKAMNDQGSAASQEVQFDSGQNPEDETGGEAVSNGQEGGTPAMSEFKQIPNPLRSLGDALKEIQQRFENILNQDSENPEARLGDVDAKSKQLEYLRPDDDDVEMQALGPSEDHDTARLSELRLADGDDENGGTPMDLDHDTIEALPEQPAFEPPSDFDQLNSRTRLADVEGAILQQASKQAELSKLPPDDAHPKPEAEQEELDHAVEVELRNWRVADYASDGAERLWHLYESLTHDLAYALCEQLRLILEPTLATRLKGDYRTGKRLNMKKVISYIASDYTKDKIWLRRTKPSQREYQVLIAIDDSRSMAESHSVHMAYETLALLGKALNRLESGDISIVKFGEAVEVIHGFNDGPLTDEAGTKVIDAFRFNQKATNVLSLLETSLSVLDAARERRTAGSSSATDLWQLEIIISDGMCQDHDKLRTILRRAEEKRVMVVFIILDSLHTAPKANENASTDVGKRSILHMDKAEFKNVDGRMELQLEKYLDSFPFEYYVVLRDVEALPDVLSSTLKQFFERISEQ